MSDDQIKIKDLQKKLDIALEALEFYTHSGQVKRYRGEIIEYDPDAGPLYNYHERPYCDDGTKARSAIWRILGNE